MSERARGLDALAYLTLLVEAFFVLPDFDRIVPARGVPMTTPVLVFAGAADDRAPPSADFLAALAR